MWHKAKRMESLVFLAPKIQNEMYQALFYFNNLGKFEFGITQYFLFICLNLELGNTVISLFNIAIWHFQVYLMCQVFFLMQRCKIIFLFFSKWGNDVHLCYIIPLSRQITEFIEMAIHYEFNYLVAKSIQSVF